MRSAVKIPLLVSEQEAAVLDSQSKIANWLYNKLLEQANALRKRYRESQDKAVSQTLYQEFRLRRWHRRQGDRDPEPLFPQTA